MTTVSSIIQSALRETNLIPIGTTPTAAQITEAFALLVPIVASVLGRDAGENFTSMPLGRNHIQAPTGYPWWSNQLPSNVYIPVNVRLMCNLTGAATVNLQPNPQDGARMAIVDVSNNFATYSLTINGNGRTIEGSSSMVYNTSGMTREWLYRADLGNWVVVSPIVVTGSMPFPAEFDDMFIIMLAMRLNPRYGQVMDPASMAVMKTLMSQFSARYKQSNTTAPSELGLTKLANSNWRYGADYFTNFIDPNSSFNTGYPF